MQFKLLKGTKIPKRGSLEAAGYDITSDEDVILSPETVTMVRTGIYSDIEPGFFALILDRSGLAKKGITTKLPEAYRFSDTRAGLIDSDYRGEWCVLLWNTNKQPFEVKKGDRIAQFVVIKQEEVDFEVEFTTTENLSITERGKGGFGSTGV